MTPTPPANSPQPESQSQPAPYVPPSFTMMSVDQVGAADLPSRLERFGLLVAVSGSGTLHAAGQNYALEPGACFLWRPGTQQRISSGGPFDKRDEPKLYLVQFEASRPGLSQSSGSGVSWDAEADGWLCTGPVTYSPASRLIEWLRQLCAERHACGQADSAAPRSDAASRIAAYRNHVRFQELLLSVIEQNQPAETQADDFKAVERTMGYMRRAYAEPISIDSLAAEAGVSRWQYNALFKRITGKTPVDYLTELRIGRARELLDIPGLSIKDIAQQTGFRDEYYFSRRFKQTVGYSPRQYARLGDSAPRICSLQYLGELLALGVKPVGANEATLRHFLREAGVDVRGIAEPVDPESLVPLKPDMIIYPDFVPRRVSDRLNQIAPAYPFGWSDDIHTRLRKIGELLGKRQEADLWIDRYETGAKRAREQLRTHIGSGETATAFIYDGAHKKLFVYGCYNFGYTLYEGLRFAPPDKVRSLIQRNRSCHWLAIRPEDLASYAGDRVFLAVTPEPSAREEVRAILNSRHWLDLPAVRAGRAHIVDSHLALYDPLSLERNLDYMVQLLAR